MKGSLKERSPGRWAIILDAYDAQTGKRKRRWHSFKGTKRQAQTECARLVSELAERQRRRSVSRNDQHVPRTLARSYGGPGLPPFA